MLSLTEKKLSPETRSRLAASAAWHGSLTRLRLELVAKATGVFLVLLLIVGGITVLGFWRFDALHDLERRMPVLVWPLGFLFCYTVVAAVWDSRTSHEALLEQQAFARAVLDEGREVEAIIDFDATSFALPHEHGTLYFADDGEGGTVVLDVSTIADDPREGQALESRVASRWRLEYAGGRVHKARFSGKRIEIRRIEGLDDGAEALPHALLEALGFPSDRQDLARLPLPVQEAERRVRALLQEGPRAG